MSQKKIPIIDLFAGPGGLGEGFSSVIDKNGDRFFNIVLSIERDEFAHQTLTLRSFLRQFPHKILPKDYYDFLRNENKSSATSELYKRYPVQADAAHSEAWDISLGDPKDHNAIDNRIRKAIEGNSDFVLIGGPPCQAYSLVGRARRQETNGLNREDERVFLYREYYRILAKHRPAIFIMENVKGLLSSKIDNKSIFNQLLEDLKNPVESYRKLRGENTISGKKTRYKIYSLVVSADEGKTDLLPKDYIIRAENYGIPQARHRIILVGVREDINKVPGLLLKSENVSTRSVIAGLPFLRSAVSKGDNTDTGWKNAVSNILKLNLEIDRHVYKEIKKSVRQLEPSQFGNGSNFLECESDISIYRSWYWDKNIGGVINHESRSHIESDLHRYLFVSCFSKTYGRSPKLLEFPKSLLPKHNNIKAAISENKFADRFSSQHFDQPCKTITSHISKDGHYYIHPDPLQCRSFTVREAARIQTFPDNYFFCGPRTQQFHQVGNAVPPYLACQIAKTISKLLH
jgi:DNA (cytosine-5)-methyltransferase 1